LSSFTGVRIIVEFRRKFPALSGVEKDIKKLFVTNRVEISWGRKTKNPEASVFRSAGVEEQEKKERTD